jgi:hypothetical protein
MSGGLLNTKTYVTVVAPNTKTYVRMVAKHQKFCQDVFLNTKFMSGWLRNTEEHRGVVLNTKCVMCIMF